MNDMNIFRNGAECGTMLDYVKLKKKLLCKNVENYSAG
jgi:hypothetical protein